MRKNIGELDIKLFVIILNWNNYGDARECVESVQKSVFGDFKIVIVDNHSTDGSLEKLKEECSDCIFLENEKNLGYAGGNNKGLKYFMENKGDLALILNNDTCVDRNAVKNLVDLALSLPNIGMVGPMLLHYSSPEKIQAMGGGCVNFAQACFTGNYRDQNDNGRFLEPLKTNYLNGACLVIKKEAINSIGYFDEDYYLYGEETDYCKRAVNAGWELRIEPRAKVWHKVARSSGGIKSITRDYYESRNFLYFIKKHYPLFLPIEFCISITRRILPKIIRRQWNRLRYTFLGHLHFLSRKKGAQSQVFKKV